jgi:hypothetical protein
MFHIVDVDFYFYLILIFQNLFYFPPFLKLIAFASTAGGLRNSNAAPFASFKKSASHFLNPAFGVTKPKEAAYAVTGGN